MIIHAYFCDKSALQIGVLITIRSSRVKLSAENVQKMNQPQLPVYQERMKGAERTRALTHCIPRSLRWSMLHVPTMFPDAKTKNKIQYNKKGLNNSTKERFPEEITAYVNTLYHHTAQFKTSPASISNIVHSSFDQSKCIYTDICVI